MDTPLESPVSRPNSKPPDRYEVIRLAMIDLPEEKHRFNANDDGILDLAGDIRERGLLQPLVVRENGDRFMLIAGNRRFAALQHLERDRVGCHVVKADDIEASGITFAENFFRQNLSPVELSVAIAKAYQSGSRTIEELAKGFKRSADWVRRQVAVTQWPDDVLEILHAEKISVSAGANLALVTDDEYRTFLVKQAAENGATARTTAAWLQAWRSMLPPSEALSSPDVPAGPAVVPLVPQAPCLACGDVKRTDELSYVPLCVQCVQVLREGPARNGAHDRG